MSPRLVVAVLSFVICVASLGCQKPARTLAMPVIEKDYDRPLPPGALALRKLTDPATYPRFADAWYKAKGVSLRRAVERSIDYLNKPSSRNTYPVGPITHETALASLHLFLEVLDEAASPEALDALIRENFDVYVSVGCDGAGTVLFTGYYSPIFDGSRERSQQYPYALYRLPPGFEKDENGDPAGGPWFAREEIERGDLLAGQEIVWLGDRFEAYVVSVQGSGFIRLAGGPLYEIGYAGHNGHEYTSVARAMVADGSIAPREMSLDAMIRYFADHPDEMDDYLYRNERFIFFQEAEGGPYGCLGQPVTAYHSVATDKDIFPRASLAFVDTHIPNDPGRSMRMFRSFVLDQDRGAAIRAPGRCDIYMGVGEEAGKMAGFTQSEGRLYYLFAKETTVGAEDPDAVDAE